MNQATYGSKTLDRYLVDFLDALRNEGVKVSLGSSIDFGLAVVELGAESFENIYWAGRTTIVDRPEDIAIYDKVFKSHWMGVESLVEEVNKIPPLDFLFDDLTEGEVQAIYEYLLQQTMAAHSSLTGSGKKKN